MRLLLLLHLLLLLQITSPAQVNPARDLVNPFIGTGGHGHTFPGACVPNGLVQLSPDTRTDGYNDWDGCGGYHYTDSLIYGFSHTHLSGTGIADLCDVLLTPMSGRWSFLPTEYRSRFSHANEEAHAGYYKVHLDDPAVEVELTASAHVGMHRYQFPADKQAFIVLDLLHRDKLTSGSIVPRTPTEVTGERRSSSWAGDQHLFYCIRFNRSMENYIMSDKDTDRTGSLMDRPDTSYRAVFFFDPSGEPLIVKVGISAVSVEGARKNIDAEIPGWDFDAVRSQAETAWNAKLGKIQVEGGTAEQQRIFYTALYHCYVSPYIFNDANGDYRGMDGAVHHADHTVYTVFSLWDTFRALHPLMTILEPDMTNDFIKTFLLHYQQGGKLPVWELWGNETNCMIGYHSVSVIADAYMKDIRGFDAQLAREAMIASAMRDEPGLKAYRDRGFISGEDESDDVSKTLEYAYDDWCIATMLSPADAAGWDRFQARGNSFQNLFDPATGFFHPRRNGGFIMPFDPFEVNFHFTEANAWQYSLFAPHAMDRLMAMHGGADSLSNFLDRLFSATSSTSGREQADITGLIGQYAHGNEPSHNMAYLYEAVGHPEGTRAIAKRIMDGFYRDAPDGLIGNEDCGQMSAWYVLSAMGFYPTCPGDPWYTLGWPLFDQVRIAQANGNTFTLRVDKDGTDRPAITDPENWYVPTRIDHFSITRGDTLTLDHDRVAYPVRYAADSAAWTVVPQAMSAPVIEAAGPVFSGTQVISISATSGPYSGPITIINDGSRPRVTRYDAPITIERSCTVELSWDKDRAPITAHFTRIDGSRTVKLVSTYANQYAASGDQALVDGLRGGRDFRTGEWQGYQGQDVVATVDLGAVKKLKRIGLSALQDMRSWIWYPTSVTFSWSSDGVEWQSATVVNAVDRRAEGGMTQELWTGPLKGKARYVKIAATNAGPCPEWHLGRGGITWIFLDEVLVDLR